MKSMEESTTKTVTITSDTDFVIAWQNGTSAQQVADDLGLKRASVIEREHAALEIRAFA